MWGSSKKPPARPGADSLSGLGSSRSVGGKRTGPLLPADIPIPEVLEGNDDSDWAMWEDSVAFQDSQYPSDFHGVTVRDEAASKPAADEQKVDAFSSVTKNRA